MRRFLIAALSALALSASAVSPLAANAAEEKEGVLLGEDGKIISDKDQSFITKQPEHYEVNYPDGVEFHVEVKDPSKVKSWQWYMSDGYNVFKLTGTTATTDTLKFISSQQDDPAEEFVCVIETTDGKQIVSEAGSMTVINPDENKTVLYVGDYGLEPGESLDLADTTMGSGTVTFDSNGIDITFENFQLDNSVKEYDNTLSAGTGLFFCRRQSEEPEYHFHFKGECSILNTLYDPEYNAGGVAFNAYFGSGDKSEHPVIVIDGDGQLSITGGSNIIYTDGEVSVAADMKLATYGEYFTDGISCHTLNVEKDVTLEIESHGTAIHTSGDIYRWEGSKVNITSAPQRVSVGATAKDIVWMLGSMHAKEAELNITALGKAENFVPYGSYLMLLDAIAMNGIGGVYLDQSKITIDMSTDSDEEFAANFNGIVGAESSNGIDLTNSSSIEIKVNTPASTGAAGISVGGPVNIERDSSVKIDISGAGETFGFLTDQKFTLSDSSADVKVVSTTGDKTYGVVNGGTEIKQSSPSYSFHSVAEGGVALAANTGEVTDEIVDYSSETYEGGMITLGSKSKYQTPNKAKTALYSIPGYGGYIKAESIADPSDPSKPASEILIGVKRASMLTMIPYFIIAVAFGLLIGFNNGRKNKNKNTVRTVNKKKK